MLYSTCSSTLRLMLSVHTAALIVLCHVSGASADATAQIEQIEQLDRPKRLVAYEQTADQKSLSEADRVAIIQAFAAHARKLSPQYGEGTHRIDVERWQQMLTYAFERDPGHYDVAFALCQLLIDEREYAAALPVAEAFVKKSPQDHQALAWSRWCRAHASGGGGSREDQELMELPLQFCVLTRNPQAQSKATQDECERAVQILNAGFVQHDRKPLVRFTLKRVVPYADVRNSPAELLGFGDSTEPYSSEKVVAAYNACKDPNLRDRNAINVYIFDSHGRNNGFKDVTSHGTRNSNRPYVLIDWERLGGSFQNAEVHEMGHAFGLWHVGIPGARGDTSTNLMASAGEDFGSGGERDLGLTESQAAVVLYHAERTRERLGLSGR
jgi:hypothetical protein